MEYVTKKCPNCGKTYERFRRKAVRLGSPLKTCPHCNYQFYDGDYVEPALRPYKPISYTGSLMNAVFFLTFFIFMFVVAPAYVFHWGEIAYWIAGIVYILLIIRMAYNNTNSTDNENERSLREWKESQERLMDIEYALFLQSRGVIVPKNTQKNI